jgi:hypothetical protein
MLHKLISETVEEISEGAIPVRGVLLMLLLYGVAVLLYGVAVLLCGVAVLL